jgi:hypothetical protein
VVEDPGTWSDNWAWGLPIIVLTVLSHGFGLVLIHEYVVDNLVRRLRARRSTAVFAAVVAATVLLLTILHGAEAAAWAAAYVALGALHDARSAMLFSLNAMTTYGHDNLGLESHWWLMGALEALNGVILFGLTTAFLFSVLRGAWPSHARDGSERRD